MSSELFILEISPTGKGYTSSLSEQVTPDSSSDAAKKSGKENPTDRESTASTGGGRPSELDVGAKKVLFILYNLLSGEDFIYPKQYANFVD